MSENYQWVTEALDHLDPALLEDLDGGADKTKARRPAPRRVLLVAACICALLVVGAVAAEIAGIQVGDLSLAGKIVRVNRDTGEHEGFYEDHEGFTVVAPDGFSWDRVSKELWEAVAQASGDDYRICFDSRAELEEFLGFSLPENPILDGAEEIIRTCFAGTKYETQGFADLYVGKAEDGSPAFMQVEAACRLPNPDHEPHTQQDSGYNEWCSGKELLLYLSIGASEGGYSQSWIYPGGIKLVREDYVTPNGLPVVILRDDTHADTSDYQQYHVNFALDGIAFSIRSSFPPCVDGLGILKTILDAYQVS